MAAIKWQKTVPVKYEADIVVIGGGIAGASAACAAAKSGADVILVERFGVPGGVLTTGGVGGFCDKQSLENQGEVFDTILEDLRSWKALEGNVYHLETLAIVLQELLLRRNVKLLLHTRCVDAQVVDGTISDLLLYGMSGLEGIRAKQFIDCSGESALARAADFATLSEWYNGKWRLPMSMMYFVRHTDGKPDGPFMPDGWFNPITKEEDLPMTSIRPDGKEGSELKVKIPMFNSTDTESITEAEITGRRRMVEVLDYYQRVEKRNWRLGHCSPIIGIREGARIAGDYVLTVDDVRSGRSFADGVARGTYQLDGHKPDDHARTYILPKEDLQVPPYQIPLRSLIARDGKNLMMAGRNFSGDQLALSSARVATSGSMMGQAAGIAAALAVEKGVELRGLDPNDVREIVEKRGGKLTE